MQELANHKDVLIDVLIKQHIFKNNIITKKNLKDVCALMSTSRKFYERINPIYQKAKEISQREFIFSGDEHSLFLSANGHLFFRGGSHKYGTPKDEHTPKEVFPHGKNFTIKNCSNGNSYILTVSEDGSVKEHKDEYIEIDTLSETWGNTFLFPKGVIIYRCYAYFRCGLALSTDGRLFYIAYRQTCAKEIIFPDSVSIKNCHIGDNNKVAAVSSEGRLFTFTLKDRTPIEIWCPEAIRIKQCIVKGEALYILSTQGQLFKFTQQPSFTITEINLPDQELIERCSEHYTFGLLLISKSGRLYGICPNIEEITGFPEGTEIEHCDGNLVMSTEGRVFEISSAKTIKEINTFPDGFNLKHAKF